MAAAIDHLILDVADVSTSIDFYVRVLGFAHDGHDGPFAVVRVNESFTLLLAQRETPGGAHLAFAMTREAFDVAFARIRAMGLAYGDAFDTVGSQRGPGDETGARGMGKAIYLFDPSRHLIEIRHYGG